MPRHISRNRDQIGASKKSAPKVDDVSTQKALDAIYRELNQLSIAVNKDPIAISSAPSEGKPGDVRLFKKTAQDGSEGFFIQGKFGDSWASGRLGLDTIDPELEIADQVAVSYVADGGEYITKLGVTYENLLFNNDIGTGSTQVAVGNHGHANYDAHIADTSIHFTLGDIPTSATVSNQASQGVATTAARSDHVHKFKTDVTYDFTAKQTISVTSGNALEVTGDVQITGDLIVDYAATGDGNGNANIDGNVILNQPATGFDYTDTYTTTINGIVHANNEVKIKHQGGNLLELKYDNDNYLGFGVNSNGVATLTPVSGGTSASEGIIFNGTSINPNSTLTSSLGALTKKWSTLYAGELIVETLVAQEVMATLGGRIMVAPTTKLIADRSPGTAGETQDVDSYFDIEHANFCEVDDILYLQSAPSGIAQYEAVKVKSGPTVITGGYRWLCTRDHDGGGPSTGNSWLEGDAVVNLGHNQGDGFIDITSTSGVYSSSGPHIAMHARTSGNSNWLVPEILRIGNLKGTHYTTADKYGLMLGENLDNQPDAVSNPFKGILGTVEGLTIHNTDIELSMGGSRSAYLGKDLRSSAGDNDIVFALGNGISFDNDETTNALLKFEKNNSGQYELTLQNTNLSITGSDIENSLDWFNDSPTGAGFYVTSNYLGFYDSSAWKIKLGSNSGNPVFTLGDPNNPGPSLNYDNSGLKIKDTDVFVETNNIDVYIGEGITNTETGGSQDDIIIGSWEAQANSDTAGSGILVKHGTDDYSKIYDGGFSRRGFDYPVHIYSGYHWGGPIHYTANNGENSTTTTFPANFFERPFSLGGPYVGAGHRTFPHATKGCKISHFWGYDKTTVPTGRKIIWTFQKRITHQRGNIIVPTKYWTNRIDYDHGRRDIEFMHNSNKDYAAGFWTSNGDAYDHYWHRYNNDYNADGQHHFGYWPSGCSKHVHNDTWCYHGLEFWEQDMKYVASNYHGSSLYISYGEIPAGTNVSNLYLLSGFASNSSTTQIRDGIYAGIINIYETDA